MKKKIEKIVIHRNIVGDLQVDIETWEIANKINEIIEVLNSKNIDK